MKALALPILFAIGTALCWGCYGPVIGKARHPEKLYSPFKPYVGIGVAYLVIAVFGGLAMMAFNGDSFSFTETEQSRAGIWGFLGGTLGALGALSLTSAMLSFEGPPKPQLVMPIVFGGAVSITAIVSVIQTRTVGNLWLWVGIAGVVVSIVLVAANTPHGHPPKKPGATEGESHASAGAMTPDSESTHASH
ncbi:MAG: hypothetical protein KDA84_14165 [Planctomycetaceae bacterium]|nr:hypothetical protein [Planctomycetaceae bacterium]